MQVQATTVSLLVFLFNFIWSSVAQNCKANSECPYGYCDQEGYCRCSMDCSSYEGLGLFVCVENHIFVRTLCDTLEERCGNNGNLTSRIQLISKERLFAVGVVCSNISVEEFSDDVVLCKDQSYCRNNGICTVNRQNEKFCRCKNDYEGARCGSLITKIPTVHSVSSKSASVLERQPLIESHKGPSMSGLPSISSVAGILSCMTLCFGVVFTYQKRTKPHIGTLQSSAENISEQYQDPNFSLSSQDVSNLKKVLNVKEGLAQERLNNKTDDSIFISVPESTTLLSNHSAPVQIIITDSK